MTMPFKDREIDPITFMQDIAFTHETRVKLLESALARDDWRLFVDIESTPDRVQHMMYQYADETHPAHDAAEAARTVEIFGRKVALKDAITESYRALDRLVGDVMQRHVRPGDTLIVCADHGFQPFRRQVHLNNWLAREGYLALKPDVKREDAGYLDYVDWSKTRAYALGLGGIYVNLRGREREGIVSPAECRRSSRSSRASSPPCATTPTTLRRSSSCTRPGRSTTGLTSAPRPT
jgi:predicted AlkP superfamily phosphohydrolase/phosphomutase